MKIKTEQTEKNVVTLTITVDAETFENAMQKAYLKVGKDITLQGFRKGKAPRKLIEKQYGEGVFYEEAVDFVLQDTYPEAIEKKGITPVSRPEIDITQIGEGKEMIYTAVVTVKPEVELGEYKGIEVEKVEYTVSDDEVKQEIDNMKERAATFEDVTDGTVADGDVAVIDFEGFVDDVAFEGGKGENHNLTIGSGQFIPGFEEQLIGKKIGEACDVKVTFPEEYHSEDLKGKDAIFKVTVNGIKQKKYPELDDEFAKDVSEFDTYVDLVENTKKKLEENAASKTEREQFDKIIDKVVENATIDVPEVMIDNRVEEYVQDAGYRISQQMPGITFEQYLQYTGSSIEDFKNGMKDNALKDIKTSLVIEKIAKTEKINALKKDVEAEIKKIAEQYKMEEDKVREVLPVEQIKENIIPRKTMEFLKENAIIK